MDALMFPGGSLTSSDQEDKDEDEESGHIDDEEDVDEINHETLPKETVRTHTPSRREHRSTLWKYLVSLVSLVSLNFMNFTSFHLISRSLVKK